MHRFVKIHFNVLKFVYFVSNIKFSSVDYVCLTDAHNAHAVFSTPIYLCNFIYIYIYIYIYLVFLQFPNKYII